MIGPVLIGGGIMTVLFSLEVTSSPTFLQVYQRQTATQSFRSVIVCTEPTKGCKTRIWTKLSTLTRREDVLIDILIF